MFLRYPTARGSTSTRSLSHFLWLAARTCGRKFYRSTGPPVSLDRRSTTFAGTRYAGWRCSASGNITSNSPHCGRQSADMVTVNDSQVRLGMRIPRQRQNEFSARIAAQYLQLSLQLLRERVHQSHP
jgi:hypothetical protein